MNYYSILTSFCLSCWRTSRIVSVLRNLVLLAKQSCLLLLANVEDCFFRDRPTIDGPAR
jgi:hypothetical protein